GGIQEIRPGRSGAMMYEPGDRLHPELPEAPQLDIRPSPVVVSPAGFHDLPENRVSDLADPQSRQEIEIAFAIKMARFAQLVADRAAHSHDAAFDPTPDLGCGHHSAA